MATWYVDPVNGQNSTTGGRGSADNNAWLDWGYALYGNRVTAGDTVVLMPGLHNHMWGGLLTGGLTQVLGSSGDVTVICADGAILDRAASAINRLFDPCTTGPRIVWENLVYRNSANINALFMHVKNSGKLKFLNCDINIGGKQSSQSLTYATDYTTSNTEFVGGSLYNAAALAVTPRSTIVFNGVEIYDTGFLYYIRNNEAINISDCYIHDINVANLLNTGTMLPTGQICRNKILCSSTFTGPLSVSANVVAQIKVGIFVVDKNVVLKPGLDDLTYSQTLSALQAISPSPAGRVMSFGGVNYFSGTEGALADAVLASESIVDLKRDVGICVVGDSITNSPYWTDDFNTAVGLTPQNDYFCAIPGASLVGMYWNIDRCVEKYNPRYILIYGGINEFGLSSTRDATFVADAVNIVKDCINKILSYGITPIWAGCLARGVSDVWNADIVTFNTDSITVVDAIDGAYAFDMFAAMKASNSSWATVYYDALADGAATNVHPNATGQAWIGQTLGAQFLSLLPEWTPFDTTIPALTLSPDCPGDLRSVQAWSKVATAQEIENMR